MKYVIFAEKPSQALAYANAFTIKERKKSYIELKSCDTFPDGAFITWGIGHLVSLKMPQEYKEEWAKWNLKNLPIIPEKFEFKVSPDKKEQFKIVKKLFNDGQIEKGKLDNKDFCIINSADIDREGSNIFYSIYHMTNTKNNNIKRLWINSLETDEIKKGFNNLLDNKKDLLMYEEAKTRQISDWLVGINASQLYSLLSQKKGFSGSMSVGRVQSPTVFMIYQREKEMNNFVSKPFYELFGIFKHENGTYKGKANYKEDDKKVLNDLLEKNSATADSVEGKITKVSKEIKSEKSPKLHSLSSLQTTANKKWKYSPDKVLKVMQTLYEKKLVSYPRTDCNFITENEFNYLLKNIESYQSLLNVSFTPNEKPNKRYTDTLKVKEHYAIIPTKSVIEKKVIDQLQEEEQNIYYEVLKTTVSMFHSDYKYEETKITTSIKDIDFITNGKVELEKGWKEVFLSEKSEAPKEKDSNKPIPSVKENDLVVSELNIEEGHTSPPKRFTEGQLINLMKTAGKTLDDKEDVEILKEVEGIGTEATRSEIIETIKKNDYIQVKKNKVFLTEKGNILSESIKGSLLSSPQMTAKWESYLKKIGEGEGNQKKFIEKIIAFLNKTISEAPEEIEALDDIIKETNKESEIATCPSCKNSIIDKGKFYGCSNYPNCKFTLSKDFRKKKLTKKNIENLLEGKETIVTNLKSKKGSKYNAKVSLNDKNYIDFLEFVKK